MSESRAAKNPLHDATALGDLATMRVLLSDGVMAASADERGNRPIHEAAWWGHVEAVRLLLGQGISIQSRGWLGRTPLHAACRSPHDTRQLIQFLISAGADLDSRDNAEKTPIFRVCEAIEEFGDSADQQVFLANARALLNAGADPDLLDRHHESALDHTSRRAMHELFRSSKSKS